MRCVWRSTHTQTGHRLQPRKIPCLQMPPQSLLNSQPKSHAPSEMSGDLDNEPERRLTSTDARSDTLPRLTVRTAQTPCALATARPPAGACPIHASPAGTETIARKRGRMKWLLRDMPPEALRTRLNDVLGRCMA